MGNQSQFNPSDMAGMNAHPEGNRASKESKLYGKQEAEPVFQGEIPADPDVLADIEAQEVAGEYRMQEKLSKPRGNREAGSGGGQG